MRHSSTMITSTAKDGAQQWPADDEHAPRGTQEEEHDEECELRPTDPSLAHRTLRERRTSSGEESRRGTQRACAGAAAAENEKRIVLRYVKDDDD
jgi:hypothetical protein